MCIAASLVRGKQKTLSVLFIIIVAASLVRKRENIKKRCINYFYYCSYNSRETCRRGGSVCIYFTSPFFFCTYSLLQLTLVGKRAAAAVFGTGPLKTNYCRYIGTETCRRGSCFWHWWALSLSASTRVSFSLRLFTARRLCSNAKGHWAT